MSYRSIVICLDKEETVKPLVNMAQYVGDEARLHLIGVHEIPRVDVHFTVGSMIPPEVLENAASYRVETAKKIHRVFEKTAQGENSAYEWYQHVGRSTSDTTDIVDHALTADLVITSQDSNESTPWIQRDLLQRSGTPLLLVPDESGVQPVFSQIAVAWNGTPQTARAIRDAMPLLKKADTVRIVCVGAQSKSSPDQINGSDVASWLSHYDISTSLDEHKEHKLTTGIALIDDVSAAGANLLVFGGYGHSPLYDVILGGVTDDVIGNTKIPLLLSH